MLVEVLIELVVMVSFEGTKRGASADNFGNRREVKLPLTGNTQFLAFVVRRVSLPHPAKRTNPKNDEMGFEDRNTNTERQISR